MSKISGYPEIIYPSSSAMAVIAYAGRNYKMQLKNVLASMALNPQQGGVYRDDMLSNYAYHYPTGWIAGGAAGGSAAQNSEVNHPGITRLSSGVAAGSDTAWEKGQVTNSILITGGEETDMIFRILSTADLRLRFGFYDNSTGGVTDGVYISISGTTLVGNTTAGAATSTTPTSYTVTTGVWYRLHIAVSEEADRVDFFLYDSSGLLLWTDSLDTNIPTVSTQLTHHSVTVWKAAAGVTALIDLDLITLKLPKELMR